MKTDKKGSLYDSIPALIRTACFRITDNGFTVWDCIAKDCHKKLLRGMGIYGWVWYGIVMRVPHSSS